ncbi:hypothetical protein [Ferruginibacter albus]|uniref:hypothetical protein n=1 Tax=Ferruginibacter albus TaxID=2875540 RepID=UPI001CC5AB8C|nr:hypothetical protein [Ferruginibacter albus]UAY50625.1 hypothetical protein K9M53_08455 [Ferruginibacter albus]
MKKILFAIVMFSSCTNNHNTVKSVSLGKEDSLKVNLIGEWGGNENTAIMVFEKDSMYFTNRKQHYSYKIDSTDIIIKLEIHEYKMKNVSIIKDTFQFYSADLPTIPIKSYRVKKKS